MYIQFSDFFELLRQFEKPAPKRAKNGLFSHLFSSAEEEKSTDDADISRVVNNHCKVPERIQNYYAEHGTGQLATDIQDNVFPRLISPHAFAEALFWTIQQDLVLKIHLEHVGAGIFPPEEERELALYIATALFAIIWRPHCPDKPPAFSNALSDNAGVCLLSRKVPAPRSDFIGRGKELRKLHDLLGKHQQVFVWGIHGIGKSELVYQYCKEHKGDYTNILYVNSNGNLQKDICTLHIAGGITPTGDMLHDVLHGLRCLREDTLLVFDNVNDMQGPIWTSLRQCGCKLLVTTRCQIPKHLRKEHLEVEAISPTRSLVSLVMNLSRRKDLKKSTLEKIIVRVHRHTTAVILLAALLQTDRYTPEEILEKLGPWKLKDFIKEKLNYANNSMSFYEHLRTLFALFQFEGQERYILQNMALMPQNGVPLKLFEAWTELTDPDPLNALIDAGLIYTPSRGDRGNAQYMVLLKPMIKVLACDELMPSIQSCAKLIHNTAEAMSLLMDNQDAHYLIHLSQEVIRLAEKDDIPVYIDYLHKSFELAERNQKKDEVGVIVEALEDVLSLTTCGTNRDLALLMDYYAAMQDTVDDAVAYREKAIELLNPAIQEEKLLMAEILDRIAGDYLMLDDWNRAKPFSDLSWSMFDELGMLGKPEVFPAQNRRGVILCHTGAEAEGMALLEEVQNYIWRFEAQPTQNRVSVHGALWDASSDKDAMKKHEFLAAKALHFLSKRMEIEM